MYFKIRLEYAWFTILVFIDKLKVTLLKPVYCYRYRRSTKHELLDLLKGNPDPSRWDIWVANAQQNDNFTKRCELTASLMEQISLFNDLLLIYNGFLNVRTDLKDCYEAIIQIKGNINDTLEKLNDLHSAIPQGYADWIDSTPIEKLSTRFKINSFIHRAQAKTLNMPFYR